MKPIADVMNRIQTPKSDNELGMKVRKICMQEAIELAMFDDRRTVSGWYKYLIELSRRYYRQRNVK